MGSWYRRAWMLWTVAVGILLVGSLVGQNWVLVFASGLALIGGVLELRRTRPEAARRRAQQDDDAALAWPPRRVRELAAERGVSLSSRDDHVALIAALRREEPRLSLLRAKQLVDEAAGQPGKP